MLELSDIQSSPKKLDDYYAQLRAQHRYRVSQATQPLSASLLHEHTLHPPSKNTILLAPVPRRMSALTRQKSTLFQWLAVPLWVPTGKDSVPTDSGHSVRVLLDPAARLELGARWVNS
jgi:hypothetical protein